MGLIKAIGGAVNGVLADEWKEYFYCEALDVDVLMEKGAKRVDPKRSSNTKASDNLISNGSMIAINEGQFMIIVEQGAIVEFCGEPGEFVWDTSSEPSLFTGGFSESLKQTFSIVGRRITTGGDTARDQRIYFFNTKEIYGNKYGTSNPIPVRVVDQRANIDMDIRIKCNGEYSYKLIDPLLFYKNVCGNDASEFRRDEIDSQLKSELMTAIQPAFSKISLSGVRYSQLPAYTHQIADALNEVLSDKWRGLRGLEIASFGINTIKAIDEDEKTYQDLQRAATLKDPTMAAARIADAQAEAMQMAAANENAGPVMAFAGLNMANQAGSVNANQLYQQQAASGTPAPAAPAAADVWTCQCGASNSGKFCTNCGKPRPVATQLSCMQCGWTPAAGQTLPKFCPNCGTPFGAPAAAAAPAPEPPAAEPPAAPSQPDQSTPPAN